MQICSRKSKYKGIQKSLQIIGRSGPVGSASGHEAFGRGFECLNNSKIFKGNFLYFSGGGGIFARWGGAFSPTVLVYYNIDKKSEITSKYRQKILDYLKNTL